MNSARIIEAKLTNGAAQQLYQTLASLKTSGEVAKFLRDVLTFEEIDEAARRFEVARMLNKKTTFRDIAQKTKMSTATIARINYWLHHGTGGYQLALRKLATR
ncbi:hypothetical protein HYZ64_02145 [Candidatus Berkelbacteria bacterium]|nr:hypothetical protein [Candidatus Berkelbacteria bacterium]